MTLKTATNKNFPPLPHPLCLSISHSVMVFNPPPPHRLNVLPIPAPPSTHQQEISHALFLALTFLPAPTLILAAPAPAFAPLSPVKMAGR